MKVVEVLIVVNDEIFFVGLFFWAIWPIICFEKCFTNLELPVKQTEPKPRTGKLGLWVYRFGSSLEFFFLSIWFWFISSETNTIELSR